MDGGDWQAPVHGVAKSRTWLSDFTFLDYDLGWDEVYVLGWTASKVVLLPHGGIRQKHHNSWFFSKFQYISTNKWLSSVHHCKNFLKFINIFFYHHFHQLWFLLWGVGLHRSSNNHPQSHLYPVFLKSSPPSPIEGFPLWQQILSCWHSGLWSTYWVLHQILSWISVVFVLLYIYVGKMQFWKRF